MCMDVLPACMSIHHIHVVPEEVRREDGSLEEPLVLSTAESPLQLDFDDFNNEWYSLSRGFLRTT